MGKYSHLRGSLTTFQEEPSYQQKLDEEKARLNLDTMNDGQLALAYNDAKRFKKSLEAELKVANLTVTAIDQHIVKKLESQGMTQMRHVVAGLLSIKDTPYVSIIDQPAMMQWVRETNRESLLTVNYQTMSGIVNTMLIDGQPPPKFVKVYMKSNIGQTGANKGGDDE